MYLSSSTKYFVMYLGTSTFLKLKYKVQVLEKNVLKYRQVQVPMYLTPTLAYSIFCDYTNLLTYLAFLVVYPKIIVLHQVRIMRYADIIIHVF